MDLNEFLSKVDRSGDCWLWMAARGPHHYGMLGKSQQEKYAHRLSWHLHNGPIPEGLIVRHKCDNPPCVRPDHLELGTHRDNMLDAFKRGRRSNVRYHRMVGVDNPAHKLSERDVVAMRACYETGRWGYRLLGQMFGVTAIAVKKVVLRQTWRNVV